MDYRNIEWQQERPDAEAFAPDWQRTVIRPVKPLDSRLTLVAENLNYSHGHGGAFIAQFDIEVGPTVYWFLSRNRPPETEFFKLFFNHPVVQQQVSKFQLTDANDRNLGFELEAPFVAAGRLAQIISNGGAYRTPEKQMDTSVLRLVDGFTEAAFEKRYRDTSVFVSWKPWTSWFKGIAWDASFFWFDAKNGRATVLLVTGTD